MAGNELDKTGDRKQSIVALFNRAAPAYDQVGPGFFAHLGRGLVNFCQVKRNDRVLDIATGRGAVLFSAANAVGEGGIVVGTDLSEAMVRETRHEIQRLQLENISIENMDAERLVFDDNSFDCVLCGFALFFFPRLELAMAEMRRVLRPGGGLAVSTWKRFEDERWKWFDKLVEKYLPPGEEMGAAPAERPAPDLASIKGMHAVMRTAGFANVHCSVEWYQVFYQDADEWWEAQWSHGGRALLEEIESKCGLEGLDRFKLEAIEGVRKISGANGIPTMWPALYTKAMKPRT